MTKNSHLTEDALTAIAAGEREQRPRESGHLATCRSCARKLASTRALLRALGPAKPVAPSAAALERAVRRLARAAPSEPEDAQLRVSQRPGASLEAPPGLRGAAPATRQWVFSAGDLEIDLQAFPDGPEKRRLLGQVLGPRGAADSLLLHLRHDGPSRLTVTDACGEFAIGPVRGRSVVLLFETDAQVHRLELGPIPEDDEDA